MTAEKILQKYAELLDRAKAISRILYPYVGVDGPFVTLELRGEMALLNVADTQEETGLVAGQALMLPAALLNAPIDGALEWARLDYQRRQDEADARFKAEQEARIAANAKATAERERAEYKRLKAKFEKRVTAKKQPAQRKRKGKR